MEFYFTFFIGGVFVKNRFVMSPFLQKYLNFLLSVCNTIFIISICILSGCATQRTLYPSTTHIIKSSDYTKYEKIAVLPFTDAPNSPQSGEIVQGMASHIFSMGGFDVMERSNLEAILKEQKLYFSGTLDSNQPIKIGKLLGVKAVVVGEVGEFSTLQRKREARIVPYINAYTGKQEFTSVPGKEWAESAVSISLRVIDVETGKIVFSGSGTFDRPVTTPAQKQAEFIIQDILRNWIVSPGIIGFSHDDRNIITDVAANLPASKAKIKPGDQIIRINGNDISGISKLEFSFMMRGYVGEMITLDIKRSGEELQFKLIRVSRPE
jgi:curli biogenesis system outer membrane secretion channel CsgG